MNLLNSISLEKVELFTLILTRISAMVMVVPFFGSKLVPVRIRIGISFFLSLIAFPVVIQMGGISLSGEWIVWVLNIIKELIIGVLLGYSVKFLFTGIRLGGQIIGFQMGIGIANIMDAQSEAQIPLISEFKNIMGLLIFFSLNAHHHFLKGLMDSFILAPPASFSLNIFSIEKLFSFAGNIFIISLKIGAPIIASLLLTEIALGIIVRTVPQMNIFMVALPLRIIIGLLMIAFSLPFFLYISRGLFSNIYINIIVLLKAVGG